MNIRLMLNTKRRTLALAVLPIACAANMQGQAVSYIEGDLLMGFHATGGVGATQTLVVNLGSTVGFRDNGNQGALVSIGTQLSSLYGADWFSRTDLYWGLAGVRNHANPNAPFGKPPVVDGDPSATAYLSREASGIGTSSPIVFDTGGSLLSTAGNIRGLADLGTQAQGSFKFQTSVGDGINGAIIPVGGENTWAHYNPQPGAAFGIIVGGIEGSFGSSAAAVYLDLYRVLATTEGANPTGTPRVGSWVSTIMIDNTGSVSAVPEPTTYAAILGFVTLLWVARRRIRKTAR